MPLHASSPIYPAGSLLSVRVYGVISHYGIATGYGTVIHASRRFGRVDETDVESFSGGRSVRVISYSTSVSGSAAVARARLRKGQRYNVAINNCEHFVTWVLEGRKRSPQLGVLDAGKIVK